MTVYAEIDPDTLAAAIRNTADGVSTEELVDDALHLWATLDNPREMVAIATIQETRVCPLCEEEVSGADAAHDHLRECPAWEMEGGA
jgi:hypothetical protein